MIDKAQDMATIYHHGQFRRSLPGQEPFPYIIHPAKVVHYLQKYGIDDEEVLAIGWLHDTLEDTCLTYEHIHATFGSRVAQGVRLLTRDVDNKTYKERIAAAERGIQMVKLADTLHNIKTLEIFSPSGIERKVEDCYNFYLPLAERICPPLAEKMRLYIRKFLGRESILSETHPSSSLPSLL